MRLGMPMLLSAVGFSRLLLVADRYNTTCLHAFVPHFAINTNPNLQLEQYVWLLNCTKIIPGIYDLYLLNIYVFCVFPWTKTA